MTIRHFGMIISLILQEELRYYHQVKHHRCHHWRKNSKCSNRSLATLARHTSPCCFAMAQNKTKRRSLAPLEQSGGRSLRSNKAAVARSARFIGSATAACAANIAACHAYAAPKRRPLASLDLSGGRSLRSIYRVGNGSLRRKHCGLPCLCRP